MIKVHPEISTMNFPNFTKLDCRFSPAVKDVNSSIPQSVLTDVLLVKSKFGHAFKFSPFCKVPGLPFKIKLFSVLVDLSNFKMQSEVVFLSTLEGTK
jgi:hypothetical protein